MGKSKTARRQKPGKHAKLVLDDEERRLVLLHRQAREMGAE